MEVIYQKACGIDVHKSFIVAVICSCIHALEGHISNVVVANPKCVFSDIFGKSSSAIINTILSQNEYNDEDILKNIDKHCKSSNEDILNAINGISWKDAQKQRMNVIQEHIDYLDKSIKTVKEIIDSIIAPYESAINLLCSVPGVDRKSAITIISGKISNKFINFLRFFLHFTFILT